MRMSHGARFVFWKAVTFNQTSSKVSNCSFLSNACEDKNPQKYTATIETTQTRMFSSSLTIHNITFLDKYAVFECAVDSLPESVRAWNLSRVFYGPDDLYCTVNFVNTPSEINVTCSTSKVYPRIFCEIIEFYNNSELRPAGSSARWVYHHNPKSFESSDRYASAICSAVIPISTSGVYQYYVTGYAGVNVSDRSHKNVKFFTTNVVEVIVSSPRVVIEQKMGGSCPGAETSLLFWCTVYWVSSPPTFLWSFNNGSEKVEKQEPANKSENYYKSILVLKNPDSVKGTSVTCNVNYERNSQNKSLSRSIDVKVPTVRHPYFTHYNNTITASVVSLNMDAESSTFMCKLRDHKSSAQDGRSSGQDGRSSGQDARSSAQDGRSSAQDGRSSGQDARSSAQDGRSSEMSLNVSCYSKDSKDQPHIMIDSSNNDEFVTFTIHRSETTKHGFCKCSVYYSHLGSSCSPANFIFFTPRESVTTAGPIYVIYYVVAGTIGIVLLIFIIGIFLFLRSRWQELYTYMYFYFSIAGTIDRETLEREYEPVGGSFSRRSTWRNDWSHSCEEGSDYYHHGHDKSQGLIPPAEIYSRPECTSNWNLQNRDSGYTASLQSNAKKKNVQRKVHQCNLDQEMALSEDTPTAIRLLPNRPSPLGCPADYSLQHQYRLADNPASYASDESSPFNHYPLNPPRPCIINKKEPSEPIFFLYTSSSSCQDVNRVTCPETSESEEYFDTRNLSPLPSIDSEKYFVPISRPRHTKISPRVHVVNKSHQSQCINPRVQRSTATTPFTEDNQSSCTSSYSTAHTGLGVNTYAADYLNLVTASWRPNQTMGSTQGSHEESSLTAACIEASSKCSESGSELGPCPRVLSAPYLCHVPSLLSDGSQSCKNRKHGKKRSRIGDYTNVHLEPLISKSRRHRRRSNMFQRGNQRRNRKCRSEMCVYENVQTMLSGYSQPGHHTMEGEYLQPVPKLPPRQSSVKSAGNLTFNEIYRSQGSSRNMQ